ncbi:MAG: hypothetical protein IJ111_07410 [Eggerthellaceae bacterium]|nr:hypothetical protein [Eggerthellaceae bacterium]
MGIVGTLALLTVLAGVVGIGTAAAIIFGIVYATRRGYYALKGEPYRPLLQSGQQKEVKLLEAGSATDEASVRSILKRNMQTSGAGQYARAGLDALDGADRKAASFHAVLDAKFQPSSITWAKFAGASDGTKEAVLRTCVELANAIQMFDHTDYRRLEQNMRRARFNSKYQLDATQQEQYNLLQSKLGEMQALVTRCEKMLLELDKLAIELNKLDDAGGSAESERLIEEIRALSEETKYYKDKLDNMD